MITWGSRVKKGGRPSCWTWQLTSIFAGVSIAHGALSGVLTNARAQVVVERTCPLTRRDPAHVGESMVLLVGELVEANGPGSCRRAKGPAITGAVAEPHNLCAGRALEQSSSATCFPGHAAWPRRDRSVGSGGARGGGAGSGDHGRRKPSSRACGTGFPSRRASWRRRTPSCSWNSGLARELRRRVSRWSQSVSTWVHNSSRLREPSALLPGVAGQQRTPSSRPAAAARRLAATSHLAIAGAVGICQFGHVGCATGALSNSAVLGRARSGRVLIGDSERRLFNLTDLMYLADIGDEPSRRALAEYGANLAMFVTMIGWPRQCPM